MRRQNPPQASLDQAQSLEKFLHPAAVAAAYSLWAALAFGFVALLFAVSVHDYLVSPTPLTIALFVLIGLVPGTLAVLAWKHRPGDPFSRIVQYLLDWRRLPISVFAHPCTYKFLLMNGETLCVNSALFYPVKFDSKELKDSLNVCVRAALEKECSNRTTLPSDREIEHAADLALEMIAAEFSIPVLYLEIRDTRKIRDAYSAADDLAPSEYLGNTGTLGLGY
jgi:hypothetical protein